MPHSYTLLLPLCLSDSSLLLFFPSSPSAHAPLASPLPPSVRCFVFYPPPTPLLLSLPRLMLHSLNPSHSCCFAIFCSSVTWGPPPPPPPHHHLSFVFYKLCAVGQLIILFSEDSLFFMRERLISDTGAQSCASWK